MTTGILPEVHELLALRHYAAKIQFFNTLKVRSFQAGNRMSIAKGRGMDFEEVRRYQAGDDIRLIHWHLSARLGKTFTKIYREERERAVYLLIDQSSSMHFGTRVSFKNVLAAKIAAIFGWAALNHHERIVGIIFDDNHAEFIQAKRSRKALLDMFNLLNRPQKLKNLSGGLENTLQFISQKAVSGSVIIVISDFINFNQNIMNYLQIIKQKNELINLLTYDPLEANLPEKGNFLFTNDGSWQLEINTNKKSKQLYKEPFTQRLEQLKIFTGKNNIQFINIATNDNIVDKINQGINKYGY